MRRIAIFVCAAALTGSALTVAQNKTASAAKPAAPAKAVAMVEVPKPLLPSAFDGWVAEEAPKSIAGAAEMDTSNAAALKEYGFTGGLTATYKRDGETLTLKALQFPDVSGAYGAYTFYRGTGWPKEEIGSGAASNHNRVLFWQGTTVVDATFSHISPESGSELRELARGLPQARGNKALTPPILDLLPKNDLEGQSTHYAVGAAGYTGAGGVLPAELVGFDLDVETMTANYSLSSGPAVLTLISYPTPQLAMAQETRIRAYIQAKDKAQPAFTQALKDSDQASLEVRRTGPVVVLVSGDAIPDESHRLLETVHYSSNYTSIPQPVQSEVAKTGGLLMNIAYFVLIVGGASVLLGLLLGGGRALYRVWKGKPISSVYEEEFTRLDLKK